VDPLARRIARGAAVAALALLLASPASASPETLKRSMENILFGPLDVAFSPVSSARSIYYNIQDIQDTPGVRVAYVLPGYAWNIGLNIGAGIIRTVTGGFELVPGLLLLPFEADLDPLFAPSERNEGLVDVETDILYIKFGISYTD
jgi:hypothetical protein